MELAIGYTQTKTLIRSLFLFAAFTCLGYGVIYAQNSKQLKKQKDRIRAEIKNTNRLLEKTSKNAKASLNNLLVINKKIRNQDEIIATINKEIKLIDKKISLNENKVKDLEKDLVEIKKEYEKLVYYAYKNRRSSDRLMFILSAEDFNQSYKRLKYLQQYSDYRKLQADAIVEKQKELELLNTALVEKRSQKQKLIESKKKETKVLAQEKEKQAKLVEELEKKEQELKEKLEEQKVVAEKLKVSISDVVNAKKKVEVKKEKTPVDNLNETKFALNKGKLSWPVEKGVVIKYFGSQPHPIYKGVMIKNDGIEVSARENSHVEAVFSGIVAKVVTIPGANQTVLISHGDYYTIYSNLVGVHVKSGDRVQKGHKLGKVFTDQNDHNLTILKFQIWHLNKQLNPMKWLARR